MAKHESGFFWGVLLGAITTAIVGCVALSRSFRSTPARSASPRRAPKSALAPKTGAVRQPRRPKKTKSA